MRLTPHSGKTATQEAFDELIRAEKELARRVFQGDPYLHFLTLGTVEQEVITEGRTAKWENTGIMRTDWEHALGSRRADRGACHASPT